MLISVITPTYNRGYILHKCYKSLCSQTTENFEWIIIDDGSTDNTREIIDGFINEQKIHVRYFYKENGGKHTAHNIGVLEAKGELIVCLDSDDMFETYTVERALSLWLKIKDTEVIGILALRSDMDGNPLCTPVPMNLNKSTMYSLVHKYGFSGDTVLFFKRTILLKRMFPVFSNERFLSENSLYYELDEFGPMYILNEILYKCEYLENGLTHRYHRLLLNNPLGSTYYYYVSFQKSSDVKNKFKYAILINSYYSLITDKSQLNDLKRGFLISLMYIPGVLYRRFRLNKLINHEMR